MKFSLTALSLTICFTAASAEDLKDYNHLSPEETAAFDDCTMDAIQKSIPLVPRKDQYSEAEKEIAMTESMRLVQAATVDCAAKMGVDIKTIPEMPKGP